jgi:transposase
MPEPPQPELFPPETAPPDTVGINARCLLQTRDGHRAVLVAGVSIAHYAVGDAMAEAYAMVQLVTQGWADQNEVARAFGRSERSVRRYQRRFEGGGLVVLGRPGSYPAGQPRLDRSRDRRVNTLRAQGSTSAGLDSAGRDWEAGVKVEHRSLTDRGIDQLPAISSKPSAFDTSFLAPPIPHLGRRAKRQLQLADP